jgi:endogenous inhibitor of DNA gyrase (YacG/DUF329 family)
MTGDELEMPNVKCKACGREFYRCEAILKRRPHGPFCSRKCAFSRAQVKRRCRACGKVVVSPTSRPRSFCSRRCFYDTWQTTIDKKYLRSRITRANGCWLWPGAVTRYGQINIARDGKTKWILAHRASYEVFVGPIPKGMVVRHTCDTPACINPKHLRVGTTRENVADAIARGRLTHQRPEVNAPY